MGEVSRRGSVSVRFVQVSSMTFRAVQSFMTSSLSKGAPWNVGVREGGSIVFRKAGKWVLRVDMDYAGGSKAPVCPVRLEFPAVPTDPRRLPGGVRLCFHEHGAFLLLDRFRVNVGGSLYNDLELVRTYIVPEVELPNVTPISVADLLYRIGYYVSLEELFERFTPGKVA